MAGVNNTGVIERQIREALATGIEQIVTEEIDTAKKRVELRVREKFASFAVQMARSYDIQSLGDRIVITINDKRESS